MAGASQSRLAKAGGNAQAAAAALAQEYAGGAQGWSAAQKAAFENPATRDAFIAKQIGQSTKGKYSGVLGGAVKLIGKAAPLAALIPGVGIPLAAGIGAVGGLARGGGVKGALTGGALGAGGAALLGGQGIGGLGGAAGRAGDVLGGLKGTLGKIGITPAQALQGGLAGLGMIQGAQQQGKANQINDQLLQSLQGDEATRRQLQMQALGRLQQQGGAMGNPFNAQYGAVR